MDKEDKLVVYACIIIFVFIIGYFTGAQV